MSMAQPFPKEKNVIYGETQREDHMKSNLTNVKRDSRTLFSPTMGMNKLDRTEHNEACLLKISPIENGLRWVGIENSNMRCRTKAGSCIRCSGGTEV